MGITINKVPYVVENQKFFELAVATPCLDLLSEVFHDFKLVVDYDPFEPAEEAIRVQGIWEAKKRARISALDNAVEAIRKGWGYGPAECYREAFSKAGLATELERAILNWDIRVSYLEIHLPFLNAPTDDA